MNKHLCRAKAITDNTWVYGYYVEVPWDDGETAHLIIEQDAEYKGVGEFSWDNVRRVYPDTVCRCTGMAEFVMTDKSVCEPLFEGDIVEVRSRRRPISENIILYRDTTTSQYDVEVMARGVIYQDYGEWQLDYDNAYNDAICELRGNEQVERTVLASTNLYGFGVHYKNREWFIEHNQHYKWKDIIKVGNIYDNPELLEEKR